MLRRSVRRKAASLGTVASLVATLSGAGALVLSVPSASAADPCLDPVVTEVNVSQGLPSYTKLVRGKTTLFKVFLTEKAGSGGCSVVRGASEYVTGGTVTITNNGTPGTPLVVPASGTLSAIAPSGTTLAPDNPADPVFAIPGDKLTSALSGDTSLTFTATLSYVAKSDNTGATLQTGTVAVSFRPGTTTPITKTLSKATRPLRVLTVPMGDANSSVQQFPSDAQSTLQNAMVAASRIEPVADGVGDIAGATGGIRYAVSAGLLNLGQHDELQADGTLRSFNYMPTGTFCGSGASFTYIRQKLSDFRAAWNAENPSAPADRVLGVVWQGVSDGPTTNSNSSCAEGYAAVNGAEAWARMAVPTTGSPSGGVAALELEHTYGGVVGGIGYHSSNTAADGTAAGRAYNTTTLRQLPAPKSAMRFDITGWDNYSTLYEQRDWDFTLCMLGSVNSPASECGSATGGGTTAPASGGFILSGSTDFTAGGTDAHTRYDINPPADGTDASSNLRLALVDSANHLLNQVGVRVTNLDSEHADTSGTTADASYGFDVAIPGDKAAAFELWKGTPQAAGSVMLYRRELNAAPVIGDVTSRTGASPAIPFTNDGASSAPSAGGSLVAVARGGQIALSSTSSPAVLATVPGQAGRLTENGGTLVVTSNGDVLTYPLTRISGGVTVGAAQTVYQGGGLLAPGAASSPVVVGDYAVFTVGGDLYAVDTTSLLLPVSSTLCGLGDALPLALPGNPCFRWTMTTGVTERAGSWSSTRGLLAYTSTTSAGVPSVWTLSPSSPSGAAQRAAGVSDPAWAGDLVIATGSAGLVAYDAATFAVPSAVTTAPGDTRATAAGSQVLFTRPSGASTDIWQLRLDRRTLVIPVTDETPQNVRLDIYADCGAGVISPLVTATRPSASTASTSTTEVTFSTERTCAAPVIQIDATDGYSVTVKRLDPVPGTSLPSGAIYSPKDGSTQLAFQPLVIAGEANGTYTYTLTGPAGSGYESGPVINPGGEPSVVVQPGANGFKPGVYAVRLVTSGPAGSYVTVSQVTVLADADGDGIPDSDDTQAKHSCYPADAVTNPVNAETDYDGDLLISLIDPDPCTSALNATIDFDANSINLASSGQSLTVYVTTNAFDLRRLTAAQTRVAQFGSYAVSLVATSVTATSATKATVKFSRQDFQNAYLQLGLSGYVPVLITGTNGTATFSGYDPDAPVYNP